MKKLFFVLFLLIIFNAETVFSGWGGGGCAPASVSATDTSLLSSANSDEPWGAYGYSGFKNDSFMDEVADSNEDGCLTAGGGVWYKLNNSYKYGGYKFPAAVVFQANYGFENWDNQMHKYQGVVIPKVGSRLSLPLSVTKYNWQEGDTQTITEVTLLYQFQ